MADVKSLPIPEVCRTVEQALGAAKNANLSNVVILSETTEGFCFISAGTGEQLTAAECLWLIERGRKILMSR